MIVDGKKKCPKCKESLLQNMFYKSKCASDGLTAYCKECTKKYVIAHIRSNENYRKKCSESVKKWQHKNKDRYYASIRKYRVKNEEKHRASNKLSRRMVREGIKVEENCYFCHSNKNIDRHHYDYDKVYEYMPLCRSCHRKHHYLLSITKL